MSIDKLKTRFFTGAWLTDVKHYFTKINEIIDYLNNLVSYSPSYKVYTALLTQTGTDAPIARILQNTLGNIKFSYEGIGYYKINSVSLFIEDKTFVTIGSVTDMGDFFIAGGVQVNIINASEINISTNSSTSNPSNDCLVKTTIEIRVYS